MTNGIPETSRIWQIRNRTLTFGPTPLLMGILNVTPDSFSDGGIYFSNQLAVDQALRLEDAGADILDIGGESTRPYATAVNSDEELQRIAPVLEKLIGRLSIPISIDTMKARVASSAIQLGAAIINDVSGLEADPEMIEVAKASQAGICAMHMQGTPQTMQDSPHYDNVVEEIHEYLAARDRFLVDSGIEAARICLDPGIGFGKTHEHNIELVKRVACFHSIGRPILVGHSRKGFIAKILDDRSADRDPGTLGVSLALARSKVQILRVHNIALTRQALKLFHECGGLDDSH